MGQLNLCVLYIIKMKILCFRLYTRIIYGKCIVYIYSFSLVCWVTYFLLPPRVHYGSLNGQTTFLVGLLRHIQLSAY